MEILSVKELNLSIEGKELIKDVSFSISSGDVVLLTGPNGCGKSTFIKVLLGAAFDYKDLDYSNSTVLYRQSHSILSSEKENAFFRNNIVYVSQEDEFESDSVLDCFVNSIIGFVDKNPERYVFDFIKQFEIQGCFYPAAEKTHLARKAIRLLKNLGIKPNQATIEEVKAASYLSMRIKRMSGGQKKLTNIFSNLIRYANCDLIILDEPLNNLDYRNVRAFSNILTKIYRIKPDLAIILVTHCRSIPIIRRIIEIDPVQKKLLDGPAYHCNTCFGQIDENGLYV